MTEILNSKYYLALKDIADLCGVGVSTVANWRDRDANFPKPIECPSSGDIWLAYDIAGYLRNRDYYVVNNVELTKKTIVLLGRARAGKSFFISRLVYDRKAYINVFCAPGSDKTLCRVITTISKDVKVDTFSFHTDFNRVYANNTDPEVEELKNRITELVGKDYEIDLPKMKDIEKTIRDIHLIEERFNKKECNTYISSNQRPGVFGVDLMNRYNLRTLEIVDTPGVSGNVKCTEISKADVYLFCMKDDNGTEAQESFKKIVDSVKDMIDTGHVMFLYRIPNAISGIASYEEAKEDAKEGMKSFDPLFDELKKGHFVLSELDIFSPSQHCIPYPGMNKVETSLPEELFLKQIGDELGEPFNYKDSVGVLTDMIRANGKSAEELVIKLLKDIPEHDLSGNKAYTIEDFAGENHDRVKSNDGGRILESLEGAYYYEKKLLTDYFLKLKAEDYTEEQKNIIRLLYRVLVDGAKSDCGLGLGSHPWEDYPRTMRVCESLLADKVLERIGTLGGNQRESAYIDALSSNYVSSSSWNYVRCFDDAEGNMKLKLELINEYAIKRNIQTCSRIKMVLARHVCGLRLLTIYKIFRGIGYDKAAIMNIIMSLTF